MSEENVSVSARIPARLAEIIGKEAREKGILFDELCGLYVLAGIEANRCSEEKNKGE